MSKIDYNFVNRYTKLTYDGSTSATKVRANNRKLIYGRYKPCKVFKSVAHDFSTSCAFTTDDQCLLEGSSDGNVRIINKYNDNLIEQKAVHNWFLTSLAPHKSGELLLTSGIDSSGFESALWNMKNNFENQFMLIGCRHAEFTHAQDKVIGTSGATAKLNDLNSGQVIHEYKPETSNLYSNNKAALDPSDELLLTDGVMFDVRSGKQVHRFKQMNTFVNGTFHTNRLEIISSSQIWDLRTFHLLQTVENLEFCVVKFNHSGDVILGYRWFKLNISDIKVFDAADYSSIGTIEGHCYVSSLAVNPKDTQIAVASAVSLKGGSTKGVLLYDIGIVLHEDEMDA